MAVALARPYANNLTSLQRSTEGNYLQSESKYKNSSLAENFQPVEML